MFTRVLLRFRSIRGKFDVQIVVLGCWVVVVLIFIAKHRFGGVGDLQKAGDDPRFRHESFHYRAGMLERQKETMLSAAQQARLSSIETGVITRRDVEIVIARYDEDVAWSDMYASLRTVYAKKTTTISTSISSGSSSSSSSRNASWSKAGVPPIKLGQVREIDNIGRESYVYLKHVVDHYEDLANLTVFTQASAPTRGYIGHRSGGGHLLGNSTFHDFVLTTSSRGHFIFTAAVWLPTLAHRVRRGYNLFFATRQQALSQCPEPRLGTALGSEYKFDLHEQPFFETIANACMEQNATTCRALDFWQTYIRLPLPPHNVAFFAQGAIFAATREQIRRRPLAEYMALLDLVSHSRDPYAGFFLEWFWYYVFTSDHAPCVALESDFDFAKEAPLFATFDLRERLVWSKKHVWPIKKRKRRKTIWTLFL